MTLPAPLLKLFSRIPEEKAIGSAKVAEHLNPDPNAFSHVQSVWPTGVPAVAETGFIALGQFTVLFSPPPPFLPFCLPITTVSFAHDGIRNQGRQARQEILAWASMKEIMENKLPAMVAGESQI